MTCAQQDPKAGISVPCHIADSGAVAVPPQSLSLCSPCQIQRPHKCAFIPVPRLWLLSPLFVQRSRRVCLLMLWPPPHAFLEAGKGSRGKAHCLQSQAWEQAASTEMTVWHPASPGCPSSCLAQSVPFTPAAHCSSLSSLLQLSLVMPQSLCYRTNPGHVCLPGHLAVGCGW